MAYENRHWIIVNTSDVTDEMMENALQMDIITLRKSLDGAKALLKWDGDTPSCFDGIKVYNYSEILTILHSSDWKEEE